MRFSAISIKSQMILLVPRIIINRATDNMISVKKNVKLELRVRYACSSVPTHSRRIHYNTLLQTRSPLPPAGVCVRRFSWYPVCFTPVDICRAMSHECVCLLQCRSSLARAARARRGRRRRCRRPASPPPATFDTGRRPRPPRPRPRPSSGPSRQLRTTCSTASGERRLAQLSLRHNKCSKSM